MAFNEKFYSKGLVYAEGESNLVNYIINRMEKTKKIFIRIF